MAALSLRYSMQAFSSCGVRDSRCGDFSCCGAQALGHRKLQQLHVDSVIVAHGPKCPVACGILVHRSGKNLCSLHWQADSQPLGHQGSPSLAFLLSVTPLTSFEKSRPVVSALSPSLISVRLITSGC